METTANDSAMKAFDRRETVKSATTLTQLMLFIVHIKIFCMKGWFTLGLYKYHHSLYNHFSYFCSKIMNDDIYKTKGWITLTAIQFTVISARVTQVDFQCVRQLPMCKMVTNVYEGKSNLHQLICHMHRFKWSLFWLHILVL